jgi:hypothetical protein
MENTVAAQQSGSDGLRGAKLFLYAAIILLIAEFIGSFTFKAGPGKVVLLPMIWALLLGGARSDWQVNGGEVLHGST